MRRLNASSVVEAALGETRSSGPRDRALVRRALQLDLHDESARGDIGFIARALVQATLPHSDPGISELVRYNGRYALSILAPAELGLPYGRYPRLVLAYLSTVAVRRKTRHIDLGSHLSRFCSALGLTPTSGPRGSLIQLRQQMQRLFASTFQCVYHSEHAGVHAGDGFLIAEERAFWWDASPTQIASPPSSFVVLSERFYREAAGAPVPIDLRVLRALRSPFEIDIYVWLTWRFFRLQRPLTIPWESLMLQFGCSYRSPRHFRHRFLSYLKRVLDYYPAARLSPSPVGLTLRPSPTHVRRLAEAN